MKQIILPIVFAIVGVVAGRFYFQVLRHSLVYLDKKRSIFMFIALALARSLSLAAILIGALLMSGWCLIACIAGFIVARTVVLTKARREAIPSTPEQGSENKDE